MSNHIGIQLTKFVDVEKDGSETDTTYGIRVYDDYICAYSNFLTRERMFSMTCGEIVGLARRICDETADLISFARENYEGVLINNTLYSWKEIDDTTPDKQIA